MKTLYYRQHVLLLGLICVNLFYCCCFSIKPVYSARYPPSEIANQAPSAHKSKSKRGDSFADFDSSTSDVWEINDDELLAMSTAQKTEMERRSSSEFDSASQMRNVPYPEQGNFVSLYVFSKDVVLWFECISASCLDQ